MPVRPISRHRIARARKILVLASAALALGAGLLPAGAGVAAAQVRPAATLTVTTTSLPEATGGAVYAANLAATGGTHPYTWAITSGALPPGLTLVPATGEIAGRASTVGSYPFTAQVTDSATQPHTASADLSITVNVKTLKVTTASLPGATTDVRYSAKLAATGGIRPYTWSLSSGILPPGLKLNASSGLISGTAKSDGNAAFTVQVTDAQSPAASAQASLSIGVNAAPLVVTSASTLPTATLGVAYSVQLSAAGGARPYTWSIVSGTLPAGLKLQAATGVITGTPRTQRISAFTVGVTDAQSPPATSTAGESITVATPLTVGTMPLPPATAGEPYITELAASGGVPPYTWLISSGSLPAGLTLDPSRGIISGTPADSGMFTFTMQVTDQSTPPAHATGLQMIAVGVAPLAVTTTTLPDATTGQSYSATLAATGGEQPYTWSVSNGSLPGGLSLDSGTGLISGSPTAPGVDVFTVQVTDAESPAASVTATLTLTVVAPLAVTTTQQSIPQGEVGVQYALDLSASGGVAPYTWSITNGELPNGLDLNASTGQIGGTANTIGQFSFTVTVTDSESPAASASQALSILVIPAVTIITSSLPQGVAGQPYSATLQARGGITPYTWAISSGFLPPGLSLDPATGAITGTPTDSGDFTFQAQVTDSQVPPANASSALGINIQSSSS